MCALARDVAFFLSVDEFQSLFLSMPRASSTLRCALAQRVAVSVWTGHWSEMVWASRQLVRGAIPERNTNPTDVISKASWLDKLDSLLKLNVSKLGEKFETLKNGLIKCGDYIFNFLEDPMVPSDNNASERGIRKLKIKLKNSCTFRSDFGADAFLELHSVVETAKKHNQTPFNAIQALFEVWRFVMLLPLNSYNKSWECVKSGADRDEK